MPIFPLLERMFTLFALRLGSSVWEARSLEREGNKLTLFSRTPHPEEPSGAAVLSQATASSHSYRVLGLPLWFRLGKASATENRCDCATTQNHRRTWDRNCLVFFWFCLGGFCLFYLFFFRTDCTMAHFSTENSRWQHPETVSKVGPGSQVSPLCVSVIVLIKIFLRSSTWTLTFQAFSLISAHAPHYGA